MRETSPPASGKRTPFGVENIICHILVPCKIFSFPVFTGQEPIDPGEWESFTKREIPDPGRSVEVIGLLCAAGSPRGRNLQQGLGRPSASQAIRRPRLCVQTEFSPSRRPSLEVFHHGSRRGGLVVPEDRRRLQASGSPQKPLQDAGADGNMKLSVLLPTRVGMSLSACACPFFFRRKSAYNNKGEVKEHVGSVATAGQIAHVAGGGVARRGTSAALRSTGLVGHSLYRSDRQRRPGQSSGSLRHRRGHRSGEGKPRGGGAGRLHRL